MPGAGHPHRRPPQGAGRRRPAGGSEVREGCRWQARVGTAWAPPWSLPCGRSALAVQALLLALLALAEQGRAAGGRRPLEADGGGDGPCPPGFEYDAFDGSCERDIQVDPRTRLIAMSIATMIGVGMPILFCLVLATCHIGLWDDLSGDGDEEEKDDAADTTPFEKVNSLGKADSDCGAPNGHQGAGYTPPIGDPAAVPPPNHRGVELNGTLGETTAEEPRSPSTGPSFREYNERPYSGRKPSNCGVESWLISIPTESGPDYGPGGYLTSCSSATPV
eukprot:evm.model.scf_1010.5 EVM.evm.TU.scf_1010.5   scf_1010:26073-28363(-)